MSGSQLIEKVVVTFFEAGGEPEAFLGLSTWESCGKIAQSHPLWIDRTHAYLLFNAGVGNISSAAAMMALVLNSPFDFTQASWLLAGLAGGPSHLAPLGALVLAEKVVDGDLAFEFDLRDSPPTWPIGILPLGARTPYGPTVLNRDKLQASQGVYNLQSAQLRQATDCLRAAQWPHPAPPILTGGLLSSSRFWHGSHLQNWATQWVEHFGNTTFLASSMEETGVLHALTLLHQQEKVAASPPLVLRAISNATAAPEDQTAVDHLLQKDGTFHFPAHFLALKHLKHAGKLLLYGT